MEAEDFAGVPHDNRQCASSDVTTTFVPAEKKERSEAVREARLKMLRDLKHQANYCKEWLGKGTGMPYKKLANMEKPDYRLEDLLDLENLGNSNTVERLSMLAKSYEEKPDYRLQRPLRENNSP